MAVFRQAAHNALRACASKRFREDSEACERRRSLMRDVLAGASISDIVWTERLALGRCGDVYRAVRHDPPFIITGEEIKITSSRMT
jgi:hypothetical protein